MKITNFPKGLTKTTDQSEQNKSEKPNTKPSNSASTKDTFETKRKLKFLNFSVNLPPLQSSKINKVDSIQFEKKTSTEMKNTQHSLANTNIQSKPGAIERSATFLAGEAVGLGKNLVSGVADLGKFLYDVESAVIARGHDLIFE